MLQYPYFLIFIVSIEGSKSTKMYISLYKGEETMYVITLFCIWKVQMSFLA